MTSRGNPSISPPAQISQQRHGNALPSGTPPPQPQQYYPPSPALPQGGYEYIASQQPQLLPYQAYGSAVNDVRNQPGSGVRGAPPQPAMHQGGAAFYQQSGQNMRPQHPQQSQVNQQYFISAGQNSMRPRAHHHGQSPVVFVQQPFPGNNNVVITPNIYQRPQVNYYVPQSTYPTPMFIGNGGGPTWRAPGMPQQNPAGAATRPREKKIIEIKDPNTGKDLTEELINSATHSHAEHHEPDDDQAANSTSQDIGKIFTRMVAESLKTSTEDTGTSGAVEGQVGNMAPPASVVPSSQQYQQPPPPANQQPPPSMGGNQHMMRPSLPNMGPPRMPPPMMPPRPSMMQQPPQQQHVQPPATPPHTDIQHQMINLTRPPPQIPLRQPTPAHVYNTSQQHRVRHPQQQPQPQVTQHQQPSHPMRPPLPVMTAPQATIQHQQQQQQPPVQPQAQPQQQAPPQVQQRQPPPAPQEQTVATVTSSTTAPGDQPQQAAQSAKTDSSAKVTADPTPEDKPVSQPTGSVEKEEQAPVQQEASQKDGPPPAEEASKVLETKDEAPQGASNRGPKDVRKGKKNKKDLNTKEIGGSDMDAFIDTNGASVKTSTCANIEAGNTSLNASTHDCLRVVPTPENSRLEQEHNASQLNPSVDTSSGHAAGSAPHDSTYDGCHGDDANQNELDMQDNSKSDQAHPETVPQVETKKLKKKKKKKGRKSPPLAKPRQEPLHNGATEEKRDEANSNKPPLPPSATSDRQTSEAKATSHPEPKPAVSEVSKPDSPPVTTTPAAPAPEPVKDEIVEKTDPPKVEASAAPANSEATPEKSPETPQLPSELQSGENPSEGVTVASFLDKKPDAAASTQNQNQVKQDGASAESKPDPESESKLPQNDVQSDEGSGAVVPTGNSEVEDVREKSIPESPVNDENEPPKEKSKMEEGQTGPPTKESDGDVSDKPSAEISDSAPKKGKVTYDRAYLMELRECASSQTKPEGLPNLEIILDRPMNRASATGTSPDFTPTFFQPSTPQRHPPQMGKSTSRGRGRPGEMQMPQRVIKSVSIQSDVKALHQSEKPWKPSPKQLATGEIQAKVENLESKALFIMNRLTPTNFEPLSQEMMNLKIADYDQLGQLVKIIFDKVTLETKFVEAYAKLCKKMCQLRVPPPPGLKENQATFRVLLLTKCQTEFESDKAIIFEDPEEKRKKLEAELPDTPDKKEQIDTKLYHMKLRRLKFYGNIRFIGELFKLTLLTENIMHDCIFRLLKARDDESLLSLCQLITTVGQLLDTPKAKQRMDQYFTQMSKIAEEQKSRIKFTLKDAIELRGNHWIPRKEQTGPKKIDEVRQDFHQEQQTKQFLQNQPPPPRNDPQPGSRRGSRQRPEEKPSDDGWNTVGAKSLKLDASKMKFSKRDVVDDNIQLGPGGGMNKFSMWSRGSGASQSSQDSNRPSNRYSALGSEEDRRNFQRSPSRGDSGGMGSRGLRPGNTAGHGRGKMAGRSSIEGERRDALASARSIVGGRSQNSSRDNSWNREDRRSLGPRGSREGENPLGPRTISLRPSAERAPPPTQPSPAVAAFGQVKKAAPKSEEEMEHTAKTIMDEYLNIRDLKEAKLCVAELEGQRYIHAFITAAINNVLERSDRDRINTGQFFFEIVKDKLLPLEKFTKGLDEVLQFAEDMVIDIPKMWTNLAQLITPVFVGGCLPWPQLKPILEPHLSKICAAKLTAEIVLFAKSVLSEDEVVSIWRASGLSFEAFMPSDQVANFLKDKKLDFLQASASSADNERIISDLVKLMQDNKSNAEILTYIKEKVPQEMDDKIFVRLLMTAVSQASLSGSMKFLPEQFTPRQEVLQKFINTPALELQALYAIQALMHRLEHPSGVIASLFDALYNEEVINEEGFKSWETSQDEPEGKGACSLQLTQFFAWLRENEDIETS